MRFVLLCISLFACCNLSAQSGFGAFIRAAEEAPAVSMFDLQVEYLNNRPYRLAPVQKLEFRTESNQLDRVRQEYALRVNPTNPWELHQNNRYFKELKSSIALEKGIILKEVLMERYILIVELVTYAGLRDLAQRKLELIQTSLAMQEKQQLSGYFDGEDYVDLKLEEMDKAVDVDEAAYETENAIRKVSSIFPDAATSAKTWTLADVVTIEQIEKLLDSLQTAMPEATSLSYYQKKIDLADREFQLERNNINLGYFQAKYEDFRIGQGRRPWSVGLGVTIPVFNPNKGDMAKRRLESIESQQELKAAKAEMDKDQVRLREQLRDLIASYRKVEEKIKTLNVSALARTLNTMQKSNPVAGVKFQGN
ncbi:MAG TPA: TolC family protein, partial [Cyclobacteriaceae bacterium]|nr:TolC family protein [Cyclobacteriaceae bacterium]